MIESEALHVIQQVTHALDSLNIRYVIGGSMASIVHGMLRTTMDVDIVAEISFDQVSPFVSALKNDFYADEQMIQQAIERQSSFNLIHLKTMFKVDIFIPKNRPFDQQQLKNRVAEQVDPGGDAPIWFLSAEDIILAKLDWFRLGGETSERQWRDILGVLITQQSSLNLDYLKQWARDLGVADLMHRALQELIDSSKP